MSPVLEEHSPLAAGGKPTPSLRHVSEDLLALKEAFNGHVTKPRLLLLVSPTCDVRRRGSSIIQNEVLAAVGDAPVRAYAVWVPILPDDTPAAAEEATRLLPDGRTVHFWDVGGTLAPLFSGILKLPAGCPAWDVYMLYPPGAIWGDEVPVPAYWQHQLGGLTAAPRLDGQAFADNLHQMLRRHGVARSD